MALTEISIGYDNTLIVNVSTTKLLETVIDDTLSWKIHQEQIIPKLSTACYALDSPLKMVYNSYFHSIMKYRLLFWWKTSTV
jgi:hypothetical protein